MRCASEGCGLPIHHDEIDGWLHTLGPPIGFTQCCPNRPPIHHPDDPIPVATPPKEDVGPP